MQRFIRCFPAILAVFAVLQLLAAPAMAQPPAPDRLGGLTLGESAEKAGALLALKSAQAVEEAPWLTRIGVAPDDIFKSGYVMTGRCFAKGRILRIKLKYREDDLPFFRKLIGALLERYGNPSQYKGDLEGEVMGNKWSFTNANGESISLIVQRAQNGDPDVSQGVVIKLANQTLMEAERSCHEYAHGGKANAAPAPQAASPGGNIEGYLPR